MKVFFFWIFCSLHLFVYSQKIYLNTSIGVSNYQGDLQDKFFVPSEAKPITAFGCSYQIDKKITISSTLSYGKVGADDKFSDKNAGRNLNFISTIVEGQIAAEYHFRSFDEYYISPYIFAGVAIFHFNPTTTDSAGMQYELYSLSTEGQGFHPNKHPYNLTQFSIPFGGGIQYEVHQNLVIGIELGIRKLFTDYVDDVSTTYVDKNLLQSKRGAKAVELAYRGNGSYPAGNSQRGSNKYKDWFYFFGITASFKLNKTYD